MGKYVESSLIPNEKVVKNAQLNRLSLVGVWIKGILLCWLLLIPTIKAIIATVQFSHIELAITDRRIIGKVGVFNTKSQDVPLDKVQNVSVTHSFFGKMFNYGTICIYTASESDHYCYSAIKNADAFKTAILAQAEQRKEDILRERSATTPASI